MEIDWNVFVARVGSVEFENIETAFGGGFVDDPISPDLQVRFQEALNNGEFDALLRAIETASTTQNGAIVDGKRLNIASFFENTTFDQADGFSRDWFVERGIQGIRDVAFLHFTRNLLNDDDLTYSDIVRAGYEDYTWIDQSGTAFHRFNDFGFTDNQDNFKIVAEDGGEYIFRHINGEFQLVTDPRNAGSYNFINDDGDRDLRDAESLGHNALDIRPFTVFGNVFDDPSMISQRGLLDGASGNLPDLLPDTTFPLIDSTQTGDSGPNNLISDQSLRTMVFGLGGNDTLTGGPQHDTLDGGSGVDTANYSNSNTGVAVNLAIGFAHHGAASRDNNASGLINEDGSSEHEQLISIENVIGSSTGDILIGSSASNELFGGNGDDQLIGEAGDDTLDGGAGTDTATFSGDLQDFAGASLANGDILLTNINSGEADTIREVEFFQFDDILTDAFLTPQAAAPLINGLGGAAGFGENTLNRNDDGSTQELDILSIFEDGLNFFGREFTSLWVNNNGSVTFNGPRRTFTPDAITQNSDNPEISPYFADVDTNGGDATATPGGTSTGSNLVYYDFNEAADQFIVTWDDVGYFSRSTDRLNAFQLILTDQNNGDFDIEFRYEAVNWTTGNASSGSGGLGGTPARAGFTAGTGQENAFFELPASGNQDALLSLASTEGNTNKVGIWEFSVRSGDIASGAIPALPDFRLNGATSGDPHLITLDGVAYDFHAAGEFVLLRATDGADFEVQSRMTPVPGSDAVTVNAAIAVRLGGQAVMIDSSDAEPVSIDGVATPIENFGGLSVGDSQIFRSNNVYTLVFAGEDGEVGDGDSQISVTVESDRVDINFALNTELAGKLEGLLGDGDGDPANDVARSDGTPLVRPLGFDDIYGAYRDDWRVTTDAQSLFIYDEGETLEGFYLPDHPNGVVTTADFDASAVSAAEDAATAAGLAAGTANFNNAVLDFLLTGDASYIEAAADAPVVELDEETVVTVIANTPVSGALTISGEETVGETLTVDASALSDPDELGAFSVQWLRSGSPISGATERSYTLVEDDEDAAISVRISFIDGRGASEAAISPTTGSIEGRGPRPTEGDDNLIGTTLNDTINALAGNDNVSGLAGNDLLIGGGGNDSVKGAAGDDRLRGNGGDDTLKGGGGDDNIKGNGGNDIIRAGGGADNVKGGGGNDLILGGGGADRLNGGGGADTLKGNGGDDTLKGNGGADVFQFRTNDRNDTILDFRQGQDKIQIQNGARTFEGLEIEQDGRDVLIGFGTGQVRVITDNAGTFDESDFIF